jgi:hypothetical protein
VIGIEFENGLKISAAPRQNRDRSSLLGAFALLNQEDG